MDQDWDLSERPKNKSLQHPDKSYYRTENSKIKQSNTPDDAYHGKEKREKQPECSDFKKQKTTRVTFSKSDSDLSIPEMFSLDNMIDPDSLPEYLPNQSRMSRPVPDKDLEISGRFWPKTDVELVPPDTSACEIEASMDRSTSPDLHFYMDPPPLGLSMMTIDSIYSTGTQFYSKNEPESCPVHCSPNDLHISSTTGNVSIMSSSNDSGDDPECKERLARYRERQHNIDVNDGPRSRLELYLKKRQNDIKTIKGVYSERRLFPIPETNDINYLTMEMKRRLYCSKHGLNHEEVMGVTEDKERDSRQTRSASVSLICQRLSGCEYIRDEERSQAALKSTAKRHFVPLLHLEGEDLPSKVRILHLGTHNSSL